MAAKRKTDIFLTKFQHNIESLHNAKFVVAGGVKNCHDDIAPNDDILGILLTFGFYLCSFLVWIDGIFCAN